MELISVLRDELDRADHLAGAAARAIARGRRSRVSRFLSFLTTVVV